MSYKYHKLVFGLLLFGATGMFAQGNAADSTRAYGIDEVVVTGTRMETDARHLSQTVSVVSREQIDDAMRPSLLPTLAEQVPGLFVTSRGVMGYGVSGGAAGKISLRGLNGGEARLMVLIDGHPQYAGIFGHPIADVYQSNLAERVEVLRGPASVLYGSNAMGGVVNIVTRKMKQDGMKANLHLGYGSYNTQETELTGCIKKGRLSGVVTASYNRSDGHRTNMEFEQYGGYAKLGYELTDNWNLRGDIDIAHFNSTYPGPVDVPLIDGDQRITRGMTSLAIENRYANISGALSFFYNWGDHWINDGYTPTAGETSQDKRFNSNDDMMGVSLFQTLRMFKGNRITAGVDWVRYGGRAWHDYVSGIKTGTTVELVDKHENDIAGYLDLSQDIAVWLTINAGLRLDHHSRVGTEWVPQAGMSLHLPKSIELKTSASKGFRNPILREMYMFPPQNPNLQPESMWNYEVAFSQQLLNKRLRYGVNIFYIDGKNLILTLPNPHGSGMLNQNSGEIRNSGVEAQMAFRMNKEWQMNANYSFLHMENPVIAAPEHKLYSEVNFSKGRWLLSSGLQYIAGLYTKVGVDERQENFVLWNLRASFKVSKHLDLWLRGDNLLAQKYEINAGYPMPRATIMGGVKIEISPSFFGTSRDN